MKEIDVIQIGDVIRKVRKNKNLRLEDLADENISPATVSNIERGVPHVSPDKIMYLLDKLGLTLEQIPQLLESETHRDNKLLIRLMAIESSIGYGDSHELLTELDDLNIGDDHKFAPTVHYLKGKCHVADGNWKKAEKALYNAIRLANHYKTEEKYNIEAAAFCELSVCSYRQNHLEQALQFAESALKTFAEEGERTQIKYIAAANKAAYLERLGRLGEAMKVMEDVWSQIEHMDSTAALRLRETKVNILRKIKMYDEAVKVALEGIEKARLNQHIDQLFDLWSSLGSVYSAKGDWSCAESCFKTALKLGRYVRSKNVLVTTYTKLGLLYMHQDLLEKAHDALSTAIRLSDRSSDAISTTAACLVMGDYHLKRGNTEEAAHFFSQSLDISRKYQNKFLQQKALFRLAKVARNKSQKDFLILLENMYEITADLEAGHNEEDYGEIM
jgi:tetratricopeptide (TPR) repeat protein